MVLATTLSIINDTEAFRALGYDTFFEYAQEELQRSKSTVSKLLKVGNWVIENKFQPEKLDTSYAKLYESINLYQDKDPLFVLASAQTNTQMELEDARREAIHGPHQHAPGTEERWAKCKCGKFIQVS